MRRFLVAVVVSLVACSFEGATPNGVSDDLIDGGRVSIYDASADGASQQGADTDGDGVTDDVDNCPAIANSAQYDEDDDFVGDACDNCPHLSNADQTNDTEAVPDAVGNACDPDPLGADILRFDGFNDTGDLPWSLGAGWLISEGELRREQNGEAIASISLPAFAVAGYAVTRVRMNQISSDPTSTTRLAGITGPANRALGFGSGCALSINRASGASSLAAFYFETTFLALEGQAVPFTVQTPVTLAALNNGTSLRCDGGGGSSSTSGSGGQDVGLYTLDSQARFEWFVAITPAAL